MSFLSETRDIYNKWLSDQRVSALVAKPITLPVPQVQEPKVEKPKEVKKEKVVMKKKKVIRRPGQTVRQVGIRPAELDKTQAMWNGMRASDIPTVRTAAEMFGLDPTYTTSRDIETVKSIVERAIKVTGKSDIRSIVEWIQDQKAKNKISGEKGHRQLWVMLNM